MASVVQSTSPTTPHFLEGMVLETSHDQQQMMVRALGSFDAPRTRVFYNQSTVVWNLHPVAPDIILPGDVVWARGMLSKEARAFTALKIWVNLIQHRGPITQAQNGVWTVDVGWSHPTYGQLRKVTFDRHTFFHTSTHWMPSAHPPQTALVGRSIQAIGVAQADGSLAASRIQFLS